MSFSKTLVAAVFAAVALGNITGCAPTATRESTGEYIDDTAITARVKSQLLSALGTEAAPISVETYRGVVQLSGFVDSDKVADRAAAQARQVEGVRSVKSDLRVKPTS